jgi:hypothetical protein
MPLIGLTLLDGIGRGTYVYANYLFVSVQTLWSTFTPNFRCNNNVKMGVQLCMISLCYTI